MPTEALNTVFIPEMPKNKLVRLKSNVRRIIRPSVRDAIRATLRERRSLPQNYALLVRPLPNSDLSEVIGGNTRHTVASEPEFDDIITLPVFSRAMTDEEAYYEAAASNCHGELSKLEYGLNAMHIPLGTGGRSQEGGLSKYAKSIGTSKDSLKRWVDAATVIAYLKEEDNLERYEDKIMVLSRVAKQPQREWERLFEAVKGGASTSDLEQIITPAKIAALQSTSVPVASIPVASVSPLPSVKAEEELSIQARIDAIASNPETPIEEQTIVVPASYVAEIQARNKELEKAVQSSESKTASGSNGGAKTTAQRFRDSATQSGNDVQLTPKFIIEAITTHIGAIGLDVASNSKVNPNVPARIVYTIEDDGLSQSWQIEKEEVLFMNHPYSDSKAWVNKLVEEYNQGSFLKGVVLCKGDFRTDWFWNLAKIAIRTCLFKGYMHFVNPNSENGDANNGNSAMFSIALFCLGEEAEPFYNAFDQYGALVDLRAWANEHA